MNIFWLLTLVNGLLAERVIEVYQSLWEQKGALSSRSITTPIRGIYNRCRINNGKVYGTGIKQHPKPIVIKCAPDFSLVLKDTDKKHFGDTFCRRRKIMPEVICKKNPAPVIPVSKWKPGCPVPLPDAMNVTVIDKFVKGGRHGLALLLTVPANYEYYSVVQQYPEGVFGVNFQTWNLNYFGFYEKYVVFHSQGKKVPGDDSHKHVLVIENMEADAIPEFYFFDKKIMAHSCFQNSIKRSNKDWFVKTKRFPTKEDIKRVQADRLTGWVLPLR